jgi:hypothetical protein
VNISETVLISTLLLIWSVRISIEINFTVLVDGPKQSAIRQMSHANTSIHPI